MSDQEIGTVEATTDMGGSAANDGAGDSFEAELAAAMPSEARLAEAKAEADAAKAKADADAGLPEVEAKVDDVTKSPVEAEKPKEKPVEDKGHAEQYELRKLRRQATERQQAAEAKEAAIAQREQAIEAVRQRAEAAESMFSNPEAYILEAARRSGQNPVDVFKAMVAKLSGQAPAIEAMEPVSREMAEIKAQLAEMKAERAAAQQQANIENARRSVETDLRADLASASPEFPLLDGYDADTVTNAAIGEIQREYSVSGKVLTNAQALGRLEAKLEDDERRLLAARQKRSTSGSQARTETRQPDGKPPARTLTSPTGPAASRSIFEMSEDELDKHYLSLLPG